MSVMLLLSVFTKRSDKETKIRFFVKNRTKNDLHKFDLQKKLLKNLIQYLQRFWLAEIGNMKLKVLQKSRKN